jgi:predicted alpha/beta hydrolase
VRRAYYHAFAKYLTTRGFNVLTWDWRGIGDSRPASLKGFTASLRDWGEWDLEGAIHWAGRVFPSTPLIAIGHSFGGLSLGLADSNQKLRAIVTVASQSGYWGHWSRPARYRLAALWYLGMPVMTRALGYFPGARLGAGEDLPYGVALQWASWCRTPAYLNSFVGHRRISAPLLSYSFSDDDYAPLPAVEALHREFHQSRVTRRHLTPADLGVKAIGHFSFFRPNTLPGVWEDMTQWLYAQLGMERPEHSPCIERVA